MVNIVLGYGMQDEYVKQWIGMLVKAKKYNMEVKVSLKHQPESLASVNTQGGVV